MNEPVLDRIPRLERAVRFWRTTSLVLAAALLSVLVTGATFFGLARQQQAMRQEAVARQLEADALAARALLERQLQEAKQKN